MFEERRSRLERIEYYPFKDQEALVHKRS